MPVAGFRRRAWATFSPNPRCIQGREPGLARQTRRQHVATSAVTDGPAGVPDATHDNVDDGHTRRPAAQRRPPWGTAMRFTALLGQPADASILWQRVLPKQAPGVSVATRTPVQTSADGARIRASELSAGIALAASPRPYAIMRQAGTCHPQWGTGAHRSFAG